MATIKLTAQDASKHGLYLTVPYYVSPHHIRTRRRTPAWAPAMHNPAAGRCGGHEDGRQSAPGRAPAPALFCDNMLRWPSGMWHAGSSRPEHVDEFSMKLCMCLLCCYAYPHRARQQPLSSVRAGLEPGCRGAAPPGSGSARTAPRLAATRGRRAVSRAGEVAGGAGEHLTRRVRAEGDSVTH